MSGGACPQNSVDSASSCPPIHTVPPNDRSSALQMHAHTSTHALSLSLQTAHPPPPLTQRRLHDATRMSKTRGGGNGHRGPHPHATLPLPSPSNLSSNDASDHDKQDFEAQPSPTSACIGCLPARRPTTCHLPPRDRYARGPVICRRTSSWPCRTAGAWSS